MENPKVFAVVGRRSTRRSSRSPVGVSTVLRAALWLLSADLLANGECRTQELVCLLHKATDLADGFLEFGPSTPSDLPAPFAMRSDRLQVRREMTAGSVFGVAKVAYARGSMRSLPAGEGFILEFERTRRFVCAIRREVRKGAGYQYQAEACYNTVVVAQPLSLWYRRAGGQPELLGSSWMLGGASPLQLDESEFGQGGRVRGGILDLTTRELAERALVSGSALRDMPCVVAELVAEKIVAGSGKSERAMTKTATEVVEYARNKGNGEDHVAEGLLGAKVMTSDFVQQWLRPEMEKTSFRVDRTHRDGNGDLVLEVDLWNRLPCRVQGALRAQGTSDFFERADRAGKGYYVPFDLLPNQRAAAEFVVPKRFSEDAAQVRRDATVTVSCVWSLGAAAVTMPGGIPPPPMFD